MILSNLLVKLHEFKVRERRDYVINSSSLGKLKLFNLKYLLKFFFHVSHSFKQLVRSYCSAIIKQPCLNKAKNGKDQREYINSENDFCKHFQACKLGVFRNFVKFTGKHLAKVTFLIKLQARPANLLKKRLWHRCFPVKLAKFLRTRFSHSLSDCLHGFISVTYLVS